MAEEIKAKNLIPGDQVRDYVNGFLIVAGVRTWPVRGFGMVTYIDFTDGTSEEYYPEDYLQINI